MFSESAIVEIIVLVIGAVFSIIGFLLQQKDRQQGEQIKELFEKHDSDAKALTELRVQIAESHYKKAEIDPKFEKLEKTISDGFNELGKRIDNALSRIAQGG